LINSPGYVPKTSWAALKKEWENEEWELLCIGKPPKHDFNLDKLGNELNANGSLGFIVYYYDWNNQSTSSDNDLDEAFLDELDLEDEEVEELEYEEPEILPSPFANAWLNLVKEPILPFKIS
jgi:hypothetical protein